MLGRLIQKHPSYGIPRLKKALVEQEGLQVNAKLLRKLLRVWGLSWQRTAGAGQRKKTWVQRVIDSLATNSGQDHLLLEKSLCTLTTSICAFSSCIPGPRFLYNVPF